MCSKLSFRKRNNVPQQSPVGVKSKRFSNGDRMGLLLVKNGLTDLEETRIAKQSSIKY